MSSLRACFIPRGSQVHICFPIPPTLDNNVEYDNVEYDNIAMSKVPTYIQVLILKYLYYSSSYLSCRLSARLDEKERLKSTVDE